jgi:hypothetical protein
LIGENASGAMKIICDTAVLPGVKVPFEQKEIKLQNSD